MRISERRRRFRMGTESSNGPASAPNLSPFDRSGLYIPAPLYGGSVQAPPKGQRRRPEGLAELAREMRLIVEAASRGDAGDRLRRRCQQLGGASQAQGSGVLADRAAERPPV